MRSIARLAVTSAAAALLFAVGVAGYRAAAPPDRNEMLAHLGTCPTCKAAAGRPGVPDCAEARAINAANAALGVRRARENLSLNPPAAQAPPAAR